MLSLPEEKDSIWDKRSSAKVRSDAKHKASCAKAHSKRKRK